MSACATCETASTKIRSKKSSSQLAWRSMASSLTVRRRGRAGGDVVIARSIARPRRVRSRAKAQRRKAKKPLRFLCAFAPLREILTSLKLLVLNRSDVARLLPMRECMDVVAEALAALSRGEATNPLRDVLWLPDGSGALGSMPAYHAGRRAMGA